MTTEEVYEKACEIIAFAGDSKSYSMEAIQNAEIGDFTAAEECFESADKTLRTAHNLHTDLLVVEAKELGGVPVNMMLIHASNHMTAAELTREFAERLVNVYRSKS